MPFVACPSRNRQRLEQSKTASRLSVKHDGSTPSLETRAAEGCARRRSRIALGSTMDFPIFGINGRASVRALPLPKCAPSVRGRSGGQDLWRAMRLGRPLQRQDDLSRDLVEPPPASSRRYVQQCTKAIGNRSTVSIHRATRNLGTPRCRHGSSIQALPYIM